MDLSESSVQDDDYSIVTDVQATLETLIIHGASAGQPPQAGTAMQGIETLQQELQDNFSRLHSEMAKNSVLQSQITYELHEYPISRLFIVSPKEEDSTVSEKLGRGFRNVFVKQFRFYFLCECGEHTKSADIGNKSSPINNSNSATNIGSSRDSGGAKLKHEVHIARREGYDIDHPTEKGATSSSF
ncbi:hypothetical protein BGX30_011867 [Mortierella sp. GBA39]|nr:hypothetical protein BGX30_011867 [Mortierella sp. GBA39]